MRNFGEKIFRQRFYVDAHPKGMSLDPGDLPFPGRHCCEYRLSRTANANACAGEVESAGRPNPLLPKFNPVENCALYFLYPLWSAGIRMG